MKQEFYCLFFLVWFLSSTYALSQIKRTGLPFIRNYERVEFNGGRQSWDIAQSKEKLIYFANNSGVLEFDGTNWKLYSVTNRSVVRSVAIGKDGKIYAGAYNEFGYLKKKENGEKVYHSLIDKVPEEFRDFGDIWKILPTDNGVIFQSFSSVFFYKDDEIKVLAHNRHFHFAFYINEVLYISEVDDGLMKFSGERFEKVKGGDFFRKDRRVWSMVSLGDDSLLIGTQDDGLFIYNKGEITPWDNETNDFIKNSQLFNVVKISNNYFVFGTIQDGLIISTRGGEVIQHINKNRGLQNNTILSSMLDHEGNLWLGLDNGIDYIEINSPVTYFGEGFNIEGTGYSSAFHNGKIYMGTNQALFYNEYTIQDGGLWIDDNFRLIEGTKGQVWSLDKINDILFCGHNNGAYIVDDGSARQISSKQGGWRFLPIPGNPNYIIQGAYTGMARLKKENETWDFDKDIKGFNESSRIQTWDDYGNLWITHGYKGVYRLRLNDQLDSVIQVNLYDSTNGLPSRLGNSVFKMDGQIYASTDEGIYRFDFFADKFEKDSSFLSKLNDVQVSDLKKDRYGNLWYFSDYSRNIGLIKGEGSPACFDDVEVLHKLENRYVPAFEHINVFDSENVIIGTVNGFAHFDPTFQAKDSAHFEALVRRVSFYCKNDTTIYYNLDDDLPENIKDVNLNSLISVKVDFSATFYENLEHNTFSYILEGFDEYWSAWTDRTTKEYTNLSAGDYIFRLKAKNVYGRETGINEFEFTVLPPWYQTTWAYIVYFLILAGSVYALIFYLRKKFRENDKK